MLVSAKGSEKEKKKKLCKVERKLEKDTVSTVQKFAIQRLFI